MSDSPNALLDKTLALAKSFGATEADALFASGRSTSVRVRLGEPEQVTQSRDKGLGLRVFFGTRSATTSTSDLDPERLAALVKRTVEAARVTAEDPFAGLPEPSTDAVFDADSLDMWDEGVVGLEAERAMELARETEAAALGADDRLSNSEGGEMGWGYSELHFANSRGVYHHKRATSASLWTTPVASDGDEMQRDYWYTSARHFDDLGGPASVGAEAARRTLRRMGAKKPPTCRVPVIFESPVASRLLGGLAGAINGGAVYRDTSYLAGKLGEQIAASTITIVDDPHVKRGSASRTFDGEGMPTRRTVFVEDGVLKSYVLDTYTGKKLKMASTRGARRGLTSTPSPGTSNLWMSQGDQTLEELIAGTKQGLLVTETFGYGVSNVTGEYSQGCVGLWIEDGAIAYPVHEFTIASKLADMWQSIDGIANDRDDKRGTSAPSFRIAEMTVAGT